jgi:hypothetical protein
VTSLATAIDLLPHDPIDLKVPEQLGQIEIAKSNWHIAVDEALGYKRSAFFVTKRESLRTCANTCTARRNKDNQFES